MANELRVHANGVAGKLSADITSGATTFSSAGLADLPVIDTTNHAMIAFYQTDTNGRVTKQEIVKVTAHTAAATSATIVRAQESTTAAAWNGSSAPDSWVHGPVGTDFGLVAARVHATVDQSITTATGTAVSFDAEDYDPYGLHDTVTNPSRFTIPAGQPTRYYLVIGAVRWTPQTSASNYTVMTTINKNGTDITAPPGLYPSSATADFSTVVQDVVQLAAGDYVEIHCYQSSGATQKIRGSLAGSVTASISALPL